MLQVKCVQRHCAVSQSLAASAIGSLIERKHGRYWVINFLRTLHMYTFLRICLSESERIKHYEKERNKQEIPNEGINLVLFLKTGCQTSLNSDKERD